MAKDKEIGVNAQVLAFREPRKRAQGRLSTLIRRKHTDLFRCLCGRSLPSAWVPEHVEACPKVRQLAEARKLLR